MIFFLGGAGGEIARLFCVLCVTCACLRLVHGGQEERGERARQQLVEIHNVKRAQRARTTVDASLAECAERVGGRWGGGGWRGVQRSITNRIHLSAWLIFPIKTAQQEPQQHTSWNRGYFSACLSAGCVCALVCVCVTCLCFGV